MHFIDNIKLILIPRGRNSTTHLTLDPEVNTVLKTTDSNPTPQSLILHLKKAHPKIMSKFYEGNLFRGISNRSSCTRKVVNTVKLGDKERFGKEQIGVKEPFPVTNCQFTS